MSARNLSRARVYKWWVFRNSLEMTENKITNEPSVIPQNEIEEIWTIISYITGQWNKKARNLSYGSFSVIKVLGFQTEETEFNLQLSGFWALSISGSCPKIIPDNGLDEPMKRNEWR